MDEITKEQLLDNMAPCSLLCYSCPAFIRGIICELSAKLNIYFKGYYVFQVESLPEEYKSYAEEFKKFEERLLRHAKPRCNGCRNNPDPDCCIKGCFILECTKEHGIEYCGECNEFPCNEVDTDLFNTTVYNRWLDGNKRIKKVGAEQFFHEKKGESHYIDFMKEDS
ncbi:DUF3795 domain-containing protein [Chloroflexota bacterium]